MAKNGRRKKTSRTTSRSRTGSLRGISKAFALEGKDLPEAAVKGLGNAIIISKIDGLIGNPLQNLPTLGGNGNGNGTGVFSGVISAIPFSLSANTLINYFALNRFKVSLNMYALFGALIAIVAGVNPSGSKSGYNKAMPYVPRADIGMRGL